MTSADRSRPARWSTSGCAEPDRGTPPFRWPLRRPSPRRPRDLG
ncbi:hypothetical protein [Modestobacter sp. NPDC049651]